MKTFIVEKEFELDGMIVEKGDKVRIREATKNSFKQAFFTLAEATQVFENCLKGINSKIDHILDNVINSSKAGEYYVNIVTEVERELRDLKKTYLIGS